jgi:hypothetical protein
MNNWFQIGLLSWFLPGAGHFLLGRRKRGLILAGVVWTLFIIGVFSGGLFYPGFEYSDGPLLSLLNTVARLGNGLGTGIDFIISPLLSSNTASWPTFEYGGRFLEIGGLVNFLAMIDAVDIKLGRKE